MMEIFSNGEWLPLVFALLLGVAVLVYAILDGYDLGVGMLMSRANAQERDRMIGSIGPFWDANETWLVLAVGLLLVAFPVANGIVLGHLYLPVAVMLLGLILRGVAFDFRSKAKTQYQGAWNRAFIFGSALTSLSQGYMLGRYILGFEESLTADCFAVVVGLCVAAGYCLIGSSWLIMKTEGELQRKAVIWAKYSLIGTVTGLFVVSVGLVYVRPETFVNWPSVPHMVFLAAVPVLMAFLVVHLSSVLRKLPMEGDRKCWVPFADTVGIFVLSFAGMAYSFFPYIVPGETPIRIVDAASAPGSLMIMLVGALIVLPVLIGYTFFAYRVFWGKATDVRYD